MRTTIQTVRRQIFRSDVRPEIESGFQADEAVLKWADEHPVVWQIVTTHRSKAFGIGSCEYIGWAQRSKEPDAVLERVRHIHGRIVRPALQPDCIFQWRAQFTLAHFRDKGFKGGFFQQWDARFPRSCLTLDYTPDTLEEVIDRFCGWMDRYHRTAKVTLDGGTVRAFGESEFNGSDGRS